MSQTFAENINHLIFSTKHRRNMLSPGLRPELFAMMASVSEANRCHVYRVGGVEDHVHLAFRLHPTLALSNYVNILKTESSKWMKTQPEGLTDFAWQHGYGSFSLSRSHLAALCGYIDKQEEHHRKETFQDELRRICTLNGVELDERYAWD